MPHRFVCSLSCACLCLIVLLAGCGENTDLDVAAGRYRLQIEGALTDTLSGPAILRSTRDTHVGLELGPRDGPGLSIELTPPSPQLEDTSGVPTGRYEVLQPPLLDPPQSNRPSGFIAFLSLSNTNFVATGGSLSITRVDDGGVGGTFDLEMTEQGRGPAEPRTVRVTGTLRAARP